MTTSPDEQFNYDLYSRYVSNLNYMYMRVNRKAEVISSLRDLGKGMRGHSLSVYVGGYGLTLSESEQQVVTDLAEYCATRHLGAWIMMDLSLDILYRSKVIPKLWLADILPHILKPDEYIHDSFLYWKIDECSGLCEGCMPLSQERLTSRRYLELLDQLQNLYERGSIVNRSETFIRDWELAQDEYGILYPTWQNTTLTDGDPTKYLHTVEEGTSYKNESTLAYYRLVAL